LVSSVGDNADYNADDNDRCRIGVDIVFGSV
jgi:hypothetical protein